MKYDFERDIKNERFEQVFIDFMLAIGYPRELISRSEGYFPDWDVALGTTTYEIKRDYHTATTNNLCIEMCHISPDGTQERDGWVKHTKADKLVVFTSETRFFVVDMNLVKKLQYPKYVEITQNSGWKTRNMLVPLSILEVDWYDTENTSLDS